MPVAPTSIDTSLAALPPSSTVPARLIRIWPVPVRSPPIARLPPLAQIRPLLAIEPATSSPPDPLASIVPLLVIDVGTSVDDQRMGAVGDDRAAVDERQRSAAELACAGDDIVHVRERDVATASGDDVAVYCRRG